MTIEISEIYELAKGNNNLPAEEMGFELNRLIGCGVSDLIDDFEAEFGGHLSNIDAIDFQDYPGYFSFTEGGWAGTAMVEGNVWLDNIELCPKVARLEFEEKCKVWEKLYEDDDINLEEYLNSSVFSIKMHAQYYNADNSRLNDSGKSQVLFRAGYDFDDGAGFNGDVETRWFAEKIVDVSSLVKDPKEILNMIHQEFMDKARTAEIKILKR